MGSGGKLLSNFTKLIHKYCQANADNTELQQFIEPLTVLNKEWGEVTMAIGEKAVENPDEVGAASVDFLMYSGYIILGYMWMQMADVAGKKIAGGSTDPIYAAKIKTAEFYFARVLPRTAVHKAAMLSGADNVMGLAEDDFVFS